MTAVRPPERPRPAAPAAVSMRDLLASCAAADAVSRPPRPAERPEGARRAVRAAASPSRADDGLARPLRHSA
ncbi:hypothetical protein ACF073_03270 [Streptomyces sp. NPDC015171]|uniref:hypothetical protein n=1 Tax=Streptomyces sp. NPDC015171 TaxID=3364945 RepID=UPI0036FEA9FB